MKLPGLHIMNASGDYKEIIIFVLNKQIAFLYSFFHDVFVFLKSYILIAIAAEHVLKLISLLFSLFKSLADSLNFCLMITERTAAS